MDELITLEKSNIALTTAGIKAIIYERNEHFVKHGYSISSDINWNSEFQLLEAAATLLFNPEVAQQEVFVECTIQNDLPKDWNKTQWAYMVNKTYIERLILAGSFIAAEIDRYIHVGGIPEGMFNKIMHTERPRKGKGNLGKYRDRMDEILESIAEGDENPDKIYPLGAGDETLKMHPEAEIGVGDTTVELSGAQPDDEGRDELVAACIADVSDRIWHTFFPHEQAKVMIGIQKEIESFHQARITRAREVLDKTNNDFETFVKKGNG